MRIACWIPKATNTHLDNVMLIAFLLQQWLYKRSSVSRVTYIAYPFIFTTVTNTAWAYSFYTVAYSLSLSLSLFCLLLTKYGPVGPFRGYPELLFPSFPRYSQRGHYPVVLHSVPVRSAVRLVTLISTILAVYNCFIFFFTCDFF